LYEFALSSADGKMERRVVAATHNGNDVLALIGTTDDQNAVGELREYLLTTVLTIRVPAATKEANTAPQVREAKPEVSASARFGAAVSGLVQQHHPGEQVGSVMTLGDELYVSYALTGKEHRALLNERLMTEEDSRLVDAIPLDPDRLLQAARFALRYTQMLAASVFDGRSGHAINLERYDVDSDSFVYWDPWGHGSFLAVGSNVAGIAASPDPDHERFWIVKSQDLERVLYSLTMEFDEMRRLGAMIPLGAFGGQGERIEDAKKTELFTWFHLEQVRTSKDDNGHGVVSFRPTGPTFHALAELSVTIDTDNRLLAEDLTILRAFIDDPNQGVSARDLAGSFIRAVVPQRDQGRLEPLATQIWYDLHGQTVLRGATNVRLPAKPTDDYLVFLGRTQEFRRPLSRSLFTIKDEDVGGPARVVMSVETAR
jgi:hypothetical protein